MNKRKQYLIDKKFQLRQTYAVLGFMIIIIAIIIGMIGINAAYNNKKMTNITTNNDEIIQKLDHTMMTQDNILEAVLTWVQNPAAKPQRKTIKEIAQKHYKELKTMKGNIQTLQTNISDIQQTIKYNNILIIAIIIISLAQGIIFYILMIRKTHKIAGPVYVMSNYMKEIIDGKYPTIRNLRAGDELQDLYTQFSQMVNTLKERDNK